MVKFHPIQVRVYQHDNHNQVVCYGILYQRKVFIGSVESGQIWIQFDDILGIKDMWILDTAIVSVDIVARGREHCTGIFNKCV